MRSYTALKKSTREIMPHMRDAYPATDIGLPRMLPLACLLHFVGQCKGASNVMNFLWQPEQIVPVLATVQTKELLLRSYTRCKGAT